MISYRHDTGAWLNADRIAPPLTNVSPRRGGTTEDAVMALEDLWI